MGLVVFFVLEVWSILIVFSKRIEGIFGPTWLVPFVLAHIFGRLVIFFIKNFGLGFVSWSIVDFIGRLFCRQMIGLP